MRIPEYLSYTSLTLFYADRQEFYLKHIADTRPARLSQTQPMSIGSGFDAYGKNAIAERVWGKGVKPQFDFDAIFTSQVDEENRDWAKENGKYVFDCYVQSGAFADVLALIEKASEEPRMEFTVTGQVNGVPLLGKPDLLLVFPNYSLILDWKVRSYCSKHPASPSKGYMLCRDAFAGGKPSKSHMQSHGNYMPHDHHGLTINAGYMEGCNDSYADQLSLYAWLLGEEVGSEQFVACVEEIVAKPASLAGTRPQLRVATHRARVSTKWQENLFSRCKECWDAVVGNTVFDAMKCAELEETAKASAVADEWTNEITRPQYMR